jgi:hypothetical protein
MLFTKATVLAFAALTVAHPGHEEEERRQAVKARAEMANSRRALANCASKLEARGLNARAVERRRATMEAHRKTKRISADGESRKPRPGVIETITDDRIFSSLLRQCCQAEHY